MANANPGNKPTASTGKADKPKPVKRTSVVPDAKGKNVTVEMTIRKN